MLSRLEIRNYAIIESLSVSFHAGFNIITGETGAGKSILMGALGLVLGDRADSSVLYNREEKCVVEAVFVPKEVSILHQLLLANDLDKEDQLLVRREINVAGKSRSFINDTPVTLQVLRQVAAKMVDLHRQFDTLALGSDEFQRNVLDALGATAPLLQAYKLQFDVFTNTATQLSKLQALQNSFNKELDYHRFLLEELDAANFAENEIENAEAELQLLSHAEEIKQTLDAVHMGLLEGENPLTTQMKTALQQLQHLKTQPQGLEALLDRLQSAYIEVKDIAEELQMMNDKVQLNAERLQNLTDRINLGNRLLKKHQLSTTAELILLQASLRQKMLDVLQLDEQLASLQLQLIAYQGNTLKAGKNLSEARSKVIPNFHQQMQQMLTQVGMPNARMQVQLQSLSAPAAHGMDDIQFLFDANKSGRLEPLEKVASGGELSRLMLSIKSQVADKVQLPTLIFDEIDTGISGEAARQVGIIMEKLATNHQLIAITHQPQIAARAQAHYFVYKTEKDGAIKTAIRLLDKEERVQAIATMLSGIDQSDASRKIAIQMMGAAE